MSNRFFVRIFIDNWQRKTIALLTASLVWFLVHRSLELEKKEDISKEPLEMLADKNLEASAKT